MQQTIGGRYTFDPDTDVIGRGGMGTVYRAVDDTTGQTVAIKALVFKGGSAADDALERFSREAEALRRLNHPNIVKVLDNFNEDDQHYLVMEYVPGGSMEDLMDESPRMATERVLQIALDLADALTRAHRQGIVHRDIKPANVLLAEDGTPRLTDFGVAQINDKTRVTQSGAVVGTLSYLSPEALNGEALDARADIWSFGVVLYEMLAGERPFQTETTSSLLTAILTHPLPPLQDKRPDVPPALASLVSQMLVKDRDDRINSVRKVGSELEDIIRGVDPDEQTVDQHLMPDVPSDPGESRFKPSTDSDRNGISTVVTEEGEEYYLFPKQSANRVRLLVAGVIVTLLVVVGALVVLLNQDDGSSPSPPPDGPAAAQNPGDGARLLNAREFEFADGYYLALVVPSVGNPQVSRDVVLELRETFEQDVPFSNIAVRAINPGDVRDRARENQVDVADLSLGQAQRIMDEVDASVLVMMTEEQGEPIARVQIGSLDAFPHIGFERMQLGRTINIDVRMDDAEPEALAPYVAGALGLLHSAEGNVFELMRVMTMFQDIDTPSLEPVDVDDGVSRHVYEFFSLYLDKPEQAVNTISAALEIDGGNALLYSYRAFGHLRAGHTEDALNDLTTAGRIGPDTWIFPNFLQTLMPSSFAEIELDDAMQEDINQMLDVRPDDWFLHFAAAEYAYSASNLEMAREHIQQSLANDPQMNTSHVLGVLIALRQGRINDAGALLEELVRQFPDANFSSRVLDAVFGNQIADIALVYTSFANLIIGQTDRALAQTEQLMQTLRELSSQEPGSLSSVIRPLQTLYGADVLLTRGVALCSSGELEAARDMYTQALELSPDYNMLYLLRSEVNYRLDDLESADADAQAAMGLTDELDTFTQLATQSEKKLGEMGCGSFFDAAVDFGNGELQDEGT